jgi:hypothetical protein
MAREPVTPLQQTSTADSPFDTTDEVDDAALAAVMAAISLACRRLLKLLT